MYIWFSSPTYPNEWVGLYEYESERSPSYLGFTTGETITRLNGKLHS